MSGRSAHAATPRHCQEATGCWAGPEGCRARRAAVSAPCSPLSVPAGRLTQQPQGGAQATHPRRHGATTDGPNRTNTARPRQTINRHCRCTTTCVPREPRVPAPEQLELVAHRHREAFAVVESVVHAFVVSWQARASSVRAFPERTGALQGVCCSSTQGGWPTGSEGAATEPDGRDCQWAPLSLSLLYLSPSLSLRPSPSMYLRRSQPRTRARTQAHRHAHTHRTDANPRGRCRTDARHHGHRRVERLHEIEPLVAPRGVVPAWCAAVPAASAGR